MLPSYISPLAFILFMLVVALIFAYLFTVLKRTMPKRWQRQPKPKGKVRIIKVKPIKEKKIKD